VWPKANFKSSSQADSLRLLRTKLGLLKTPVAGAFAPVAWPEGLYRRFYFGSYQRRFKPLLLTDTFEDGKLTLRTQESQALSLDDLPQLAMTKVVEFHRCFQGARLRVDLRGISEDRFIESIAAALGGVVVTRKDTTFIDVNPKEYAARALAYWMESAKLAEKQRDHVEAADADYMIKLLPALPVKLIKKGLDDPKKDYGLPFGVGTPVFEAAWKRVRVYAAKNTESANQVHREDYRPGATGVRANRSRWQSLRRFL
jgi:hypothetical protein